MAEYNYLDKLTKTTIAGLAVAHGRELDSRFTKEVAIDDTYVAKLWVTLNKFFPSTREMSIYILNLKWR